MKLISSITLSLILCVSYAQITNQDYPNIIMGKEEVTEVKFTIIDSLTIKRTYKTFKDAKNKTLEQLFISILSATNQEWVDYNTLYGENESIKKSEDYFNSIKQMDIDKNYLKLIHKLEFKLDNKPTVIPPSASASVSLVKV